MAVSEERGMNLDRLSRQYKFLTGRASFHDEQAQKQGSKKDIERHRLASATLRRDASAVAMILGDVKGTRENLEKAGKVYVDVGLPYGLFLQSLARVGTHLPPEIPDWLAKRAEPSRGGMGERQDDNLPTYAYSSARVPRQLLSFIQMCKINEYRSEPLELSARESLSPYGGITVGSSGMTMRAYLELLVPRARRDHRDRFFDSLNAAFIRRSELIEVARSDRYHWERLTNPVDLIDFDLLALVLAAPDMFQRWIALQVDRHRDPLTDLPIKIADFLRRTP